MSKYELSDAYDTSKGWRTMSLKFLILDVFSVPFSDPDTLSKINNNSVCYCKIPLHHIAKEMCITRVLNFLEKDFIFQNDKITLYIFSFSIASKRLNR